MLSHECELFFHALLCQLSLLSYPFRLEPCLLLFFTPLLARATNYAPSLLTALSRASAKHVVPVAHNHEICQDDFPTPNFVPSIILKAKNANSGG